MDPDDVRAALDPENYYDDLGEDEWERLERTVKATFEFENTTDYLEQYLPGEGHVLDAGGAAGRYAIWLAERGYRVTLADISGEQLDVAREKVREHGIEDRVAVERADVRELPYADDAFDAVCCLGGPLSHVVDGGKRERVARELRRVTLSGGPVFVSVMGFVAVVQNLVKCAPEFPEGVRQLPDLIETGTYDPDLVVKHGIEEPSFVACHFFRAEELRDLLEENGLDVTVVAGLEGPASNFHSEIEDASAEDQERIREVVQRVREDPTFADLSEHILAVGRVQ